MTGFWTAGRVVELIAQVSGVRYTTVHAWRILRQLKWSYQRPVGRALERDEASIRGWKKQRWPEARQRRQTIVFVDESGLSERPHRCRTWSLRGQTPVLQYHSTGICFRQRRG
jgi:hypothetical protein